MSWRWADICIQVIYLVPNIECTIVRWDKPPLGWFKLNTDDSCNEEGLTSTGGIIKDSGGILILAFAQAVGMGTSNYAKIKSAFLGVNWCISHGIWNIVLECDSLIIVNMLKGHTKLAW